MDIDEFLKKLPGKDMEEKQNEATATWEKVIRPNTSYLITGDVGTGKSALAFNLLEHFSQKYSLLPAVVGIPREKQDLLPPNFVVKDSPDECAELEDAIVFIDEADLQLPLEDTKARQHVVNFLSLPRQRRQIFLLAFHFPRLVLGRYLPFFSGFLFKRPPYLLEFASKSKGDALYQMMERAEERFAELVPPDWQPDEKLTQPLSVIKHTYVVAPRIRWQGMLTNPVCSFWSQELSEVWAGTKISTKQKDLFNIKPEVLTTEERLEKYGVPPELWEKVIQMDRDHSLEELREMCRQKGLPTSGDKKKLAGYLLLEFPDDKRTP